MIILGNDASVFNDNLTLLRAYKTLERRVKALEENGGGGSYILPTASPTVKGGVKIGSGLQMDGEVLSATGGSSYELPVASETTLGGIKVGEGLGINSHGYLFIQNRGKEIVIDRHDIMSPIVGATIFTDGFLFGICTDVKVPKKDYMNPLTFVNVDDETDTKTLYIENTSFSMQHTLRASKDGYKIAINWNGRILDTIGAGWGDIYPIELSLFDTTSQGDAGSPITAPAQEVRIDIESYGPDNFFVSSVVGDITELSVWIEGKNYKWTGDIPFSDIIDSGSSAFVSLWGTWFCQRDITE